MLKAILVSVAASAAAAALRALVGHIERRGQRAAAQGPWEWGGGREAETRDPDGDFPDPDQDSRWG